jgi:formylglycine-generating enzyme required for sulfatase activity
MKKDREKLVQELARATVRIETATVPEPAAAQASHVGPAAGQPKADVGRQPAPVRKPSPSPEGAASERDDSDAIGKVNQQLATAQREALQELAQRGVLPPEGMVLIPAGEFLMGAEDGLPDARPPHRTHLSSYWIDKYEVTNAQYRLCVQSGVCSSPKDSKAFADPQRAQHPVTNLTWGQARTFCQWSGRRLPTEAEWEKAARGTDGRRYPWGNSVEVIRSRLKDQDIKASSNGTIPVGSQPETVSPYGVFDLVGNAWEWVKDWYAEDFYATAPSHDPQGPLRGSFRVLRGGDWSQSPLELRTSYRAWDEMTYWGPTLGFRCAADVP